MCHRALDWPRALERLSLGHEEGGRRDPPEGRKEGPFLRKEGPLLRKRLLLRCSRDVVERIADPPPHRYRSDSDFCFL